MLQAFSTRILPNGCYYVPLWRECAKASVAFQMLSCVHVANSLSDWTHVVEPQVRKQLHFKSH